MTQRFLLRVEAMNLASFVYDTSRLPTVRGGGLLLLRAPKKIETWLKADPRASAVETLRAGASAGVFAFEAEPADAKALRDALEAWLGEDKELEHATFAVDVLAASGDYQRDLEALLAVNRFRQMRSPTAAYPSQASEGPCAVDGIRPGSELDYLPGEGRQRKGVSISVKLRTEYGRKQKQAFYKEEAGEELDGDFLEEMPFARDFHDLADDPSQGRLDGKMAVLHFDGNGFGEFQRKHCKTAGEARRFDEALQTQKREMLRSLLEEIHSQPTGWLSRGKSTVAYRFETLLWGGDELLFVVPAWKGWWLLGEIYERMSGLAWTFDGRPLTFAAGLVLCHSKAPIRRIKRLAEVLAEEAKAVSREESFAAYQVLESFDLVPANFEEFRNERSAGRDRAQMVVAGRKVKALGEALRDLKPLVPRKRLYRLTSAILGGNAELVERQREELRRATPGSAGGWKKLEDASRSAEAGELHLAELWDYVKSPAPEASAQELEVADATR